MSLLEAEVEPEGRGSDWEGMLTDFLARDVEELVGR